MSTIYIKSVDELINKFGHPNLTAAAGGIVPYPNYSNVTYADVVKIQSHSFNEVTIRTGHSVLNIQLEDGSTETISRADLIKYIGEQKLVRENELVREMYERYQVTVKLVRSDDNDTGV